MSVTERTKEIIENRIKESKQKVIDSWDLGLCYASIGDILPIHSIGAMEYPFFSLKQLETSPFTFEYQTGASISISGNAQMEVKKKSKTGEIITEIKNLGRATATDEKLWIYLISKLHEYHAKTGNLHRTVCFGARDFFKSIGCKIGGSQFDMLDRTLRRLAATTVTCNLISEQSGKGGKIITKKEVLQFSLINGFYYEKVSEKNTAKMEIFVELPVWLVETIHNKALLQINPQYMISDLNNFEKRLYLLCQKFFGNNMDKAEWQIKITNLQARLGSSGKPYHFKAELKKIIEKQSIPDLFVMRSECEKKIIVLRNN